MTGKSPARLRMTIWYEATQRPPPVRELIPPSTRGNLPLQETTLAEIFRAAGYHTAHVGKWHLGDAAHYPENHGFDINVGGTMWGAPPTFFSPYRGPFGRSRELRYVPRLEGAPPGEYLTDRLTDEALNILDDVKDRPFFLHLSYHAVHTPIEAKPDLVERYRNRLRPGSKHRNPTYAAMVHTLDDNVGRLLARLDEWGIAERTVVIFTSDNGGFINPHGNMDAVTNNAPLRSGKGSLYEGGIRVPLLIRWPGRSTAGTECDEPVVTMDLFATIAATLPHAAASIAADEQDGVSLLPLLADAEANLAERPLFFHYPHYYTTTSPVGAVRKGEWKLMEFFEEMRVELYNLRDDLGEKIDLAAQRPQQTARLRDELHQWRDSLNAQMPTRNANAER